MTSRRTAIGCALLITAACLGSVCAAVDPIYGAGAMLGRDLYWVPEDGLLVDTVAWDELASVMPPQERAGVRSVDSALSLLVVRGWKLVKVGKCSAMALGLLVEKGYRICVLSQWHASCNSKVLMPMPGMPQKAMRHNLVSDFHWELVEAANVSSNASNRSEYKVRVDFKGHGYSQWDGHDRLTKDSRQILGTKGFSVSITELSYYEDLNVRRRVYQVYLIVKDDKAPKDIVRDIEKGMDVRKLDLSYVVPTMTEVERTQAPPPKQDAAPEKVKEEVGEGQPETAQDTAAAAAQAEPAAAAGNDTSSAGEPGQPPQE